MIEKFVPDMYQKSIFSVNYKCLKNQGIKCILFDLDNTLSSPFIKEPTEKVKELFFGLKEEKFKLIIFSNANKKRLEPFKNILDVDVAYRSMKPCSFKFNKIFKLYKLELSEVVIIGDQLLTDVLGGNNVGIKTILVNPISKKDHNPLTKLNRKLEKIIMNKLIIRKLFVKGKYYED